MGTECQSIKLACNPSSLMHQSIPAAPIPPPRLTPVNLPFFSYGGQIPRGLGHLSCQMPGGGDKSRGQMPRPKSTTKFVA